MPRKDGTPTAQEKRDQKAQDRALSRLEDWAYYQGCACRPDVLRQRIEYLERQINWADQYGVNDDVVYWQRAAQLRGFQDAAVQRGLATYD